MVALPKQLISNVKEIERIKPFYRAFPDVCFGPHDHAADCSFPQLKAFFAPCSYNTYIETVRRLIALYRTLLLTQCTLSEVHLDR